MEIHGLTNSQQKMKKQTNGNSDLFNQPRNGLIKCKVLTSGGPHDAMCQNLLNSLNDSFDQFNFVLPDSNPGKLQVIPKYFQDMDATTKSVSSNSRSKNLDPAEYANSGKPKPLK